MTIQSTLTEKLEGNVDEGNSSANMPVELTKTIPVVPLTTIYTWDGSAVVLTSDTSEVSVGKFIRLAAGGDWYQIASIGPNVSVTVTDFYSIGSFPIGAGALLAAIVDPPPPLSGTGALDAFSDAIAETFNTEPLELASFTVSSLPSASERVGRMLFVSNATGGSIPAFSDGVSWRRMDTRAVIS